MFDFDDWSLPMLLDVLVAEEQLPVRIMEHVLERRPDALSDLVAKLEERNQDHTDDFHSIWLMVLLGQLRQPDAVPALLSVLRNATADSAPEAMVASEALARIGSPAVPALQALLFDAAPRQRLWVYATAGLISDAAATKLLTTALTTDSELADVVATALADQGDDSVIPNLYAALQTCSSWQRVDVEDAIKALHRRERSEQPFSQDWRFRYRMDPELGMLSPSWPLVAEVLRKNGVHQDRPAIEVRPLEDILADPPELTEPERCECCDVETWRGTGVLVCPATALDIAMLQHHSLGQMRDRFEIDDLFDLLDVVDLQLEDLKLAGPPKRSRAREKWEDQSSRLHLQRGACMWAIEQGAQNVGQARAILLSEAMRLADRYGDPRGLFVPARELRSEPRTGRNDPCPCGSGRKYKKCCGRALPAGSVASQTQLLTTGHETLTFSRAFYSIADRAAVTKALENCRLLDHDPIDESFVWFEEVGEGIRRVLGTIRLTGDGLVLEAMSEARLARLKTLVQSIAGDWLTHDGDNHDDAAQLLADARRPIGGRPE